jgi:hypothetical protein
MDTCIVFLCNKAYFQRFIKTCELLVTNGKYRGPICLVIGDDLFDDDLLDHEIILKHKVTIKYFPDIVFPTEFTEVIENIDNPNSDRRNITKIFQWHKLHLFNVWFKLYKYIFYMDCGITILGDIAPILKEKTENKLLAHSDAYPSYEWKLRGQFDTTNTKYFTELASKFNLERDYFQTTVMLFDTNIINDNTYDDLYKLAVAYPISKTNEQGIMCLYFSSVWQPMKIKNDETYLYDYMSRNPSNKYIMLKWF